jgi:hypothetical protein
LKGDPSRDKSFAEQVSAGLRVMAIAKEIAALYARATGREGPPADAASWA